MQNETTPAEGQNSAKLEAESALRDAACSPSVSDTPVSDAAEIIQTFTNLPPGKTGRVPLKVAQKLERDLAESRQTLDRIARLSVDLSDSPKSLQSHMTEWAKNYLENVERTRR